MFARITRLQYWKSEHTAETCQDKLLDHLGTGLFAVADGASTSSFPQLWAEVLVRHFLEVPLLSTHAFELEWWVRLAQERYAGARPKLELLTPLAREKETAQGSESTLVTLRIASVDATSAQAESLAFGDSCVLIGRPDTQQVRLTFPLKQDTDFDRRPICLPSNLGSFSRAFHRCEQLGIALTAGDLVMLATDALSRWIIGKGGGQYQQQWDAFHAVAQQQPGAGWEAFIQQQRHNKTMVDDDCTALLIELQDDTSASLPAASQDPAQDAGFLGLTPPREQAVINERLRRFQQARTDQNRELEAIYYGDGSDLGASLKGQITEEEIEQARKISDALRAVISASAASYGKLDFVPKMREVWARHQDLLQNEPCAAGIRKTLEAHGVFQKPTAAASLSQQQMIAAVQPLAPASAGYAALESHQNPPLLLDQQRQPQQTQTRDEALAAFRYAVVSQRLEAIGSAYEYLQRIGESASLDPHDARLGDFALSLVHALAQQQDEILAEANERLLGSGYEGHFILSDEARERLREAQEVIILQRDPEAVLASVNKTTITIGHLIQAKSLRRPYLHWRIQQFQQAIAANPAEERRLRPLIEQWQVELTSPKHFHDITLEEMIDDTFILWPLQQELVQGGFSDFNLTAELETTRQAMNNLLGPSAHSDLFGDQGLSSKDIWLILAIFVRRSRFRAHFKQISPSAASFDEWLQQQRAQIKITRKDGAAESASKKLQNILKRSKPTA